MPGWILAIDVGTTSTAAARRVGDRVDMVLLQGAPRMPSTVFWREATETGTPGRVVIGTEAEELAGLAPWCLERTPKARLGEEFIQLGDKQIRPVELISEIIKEVYDEALQLSGGEPPAEVRLTHPARWRESRLDKLVEAAKLAGIEDPVLVPEPVAAAIHFASERLRDGEHVAVYDLGGGTLDTAVLKRAGSTFEVVGRTGGNEEIGGEDFDDDVFRFLGDKLDGEAWKRIRTADERRDRTWGQASRDFRQQARLAKERLSRNPEYEFYAPPPLDQELQISAEDFERRITPTLRGTISELQRTILAAKLQVSDLSAVYLAGGSSRIPLVARLIREELGITPQYLDDPKAVIALGAARMESEAAERTVIAERALAEKTIPRPGESDATRPDAGDRTDPARLPPPPPPPPEDPPPGRGAVPGGGAGGLGETRGGGARGKSNRGKILAGVAAAVVVLGGVGAAIALSGGGGSPGTTMSDTDPPPPPPPPPTPSPEEELKQLVAGQYRDCDEEPRNQREDGATLGLTCNAPPGFGLIIEQFSNRADINVAVKKYSEGLTRNGACLDDGWNRRTTYTWFGQVSGDLICRAFDGPGNSVYWSDWDRLSMGFLDGDDSTTENQAFNAWIKVNQPPE